MRKLLQAPVILGIAAATPFPGSNEASQILNRLGMNSGNLLFCDAAAALFPNSVRSGYRLEAEQLQIGTDCIVIPAANWLNAKSDFGWLAEQIERVNLPTIVLGLGAQAASDAPVPELSPGTRRFIEVVSERAKYISVRGQFTAEVLDSFGVSNAMITGCPSLLMKEFFGGGVDQSKLSFDNPVIQSTRFIGFGKADLNRDLFRFGLEQQLDMVFQSELPEIRILLREELDPRDVKILETVYGGPIAEIRNYVEAHGHFFCSTMEWLHYLKAKSLVIGTRVHGVISALIVGTPATLLVHDARTNEMAASMGLPHLIPDSKSLQLSDYVDFHGIAAFENSYSGYKSNFLKFFSEVELHVAIN